LTLLHHIHRRAYHGHDHDHHETRQLRKGEFCWLDTSVIAAYGPRIGAYGIAVYAALASHASHTTQTCFPSIKRIASLIHLSRATVKRTLRTLEREGLIDTQARKDGEGDPTSNLYTLLDPTVRMLPQQDTPEEGGLSPEERKLPETLPPVTTDPTGGFPQNPEPDPHQPKERTKASDFAFASRGKEDKPKLKPPAPAYDLYGEAASWNHVATLPAMNPADRPDSQLDALNLTPEDHDRLYAAAKASLLEKGAKWGLIPTAAIHSEMLVLWEHEQAQERGGGVERMPATAA
jgi:hypothetical protein